MSARIAFRVYGTPAPQGSKRHVGNGIMVESSAKVRPWRQDVKYAALEARNVNSPHPPYFDPLVGPVSAELTFYLARPKGHYGSGRNADSLKPSAPAHPHRKPDLDKLVRSTLDALGEAFVWKDDSQVVCLHVTKKYASDDEPAGAHIRVDAA